MQILHVETPAVEPAAFPMTGVSLPPKKLFHDGNWWERLGFDATSGGTAWFAPRRAGRGAS